MISDDRIEQLAKSLIDDFGPAALTKATRHHDELLKAGDPNSAAGWRSVIHAIRERLATRQDPPAP